VPPAFDGPILIVVIALPKMALRIALAAGHGTDSQHGSTLALFEIKDQPTNGHTTGTQIEFQSRSKRMFWPTDSQSTRLYKPAD
jgi:hypothetical protein